MQSSTMIRSLVRLALPLSLCLRANAIAQQTPAPTPTPTSAFAQVEYSFLFKRQECPVGTYQCSEPGFDNICCTNSQVCARDESNSPACCPSGAVCTGTAPGSPGSAPTAEASYVPNQYFPFPYIPLLMEQEECYSAVRQCSSNYDTCVTRLQGGSGSGVTIVVPGGAGTTIVGDSPNLGSSATPVCSSLSSQACYQINNNDCAQPTTKNGFVIESDSAARPTNAPRLAGVAAGVGMGVALLAGLR
ncbi:hypothetical protein F5X68DRAFT_18074 [Plectosphaerella plurivora]|uniref:Gpi-anchored protein n=1 Tax=Plectosphaerella plurivora TaxID=936078 RepID=A0A9P8VAC5_9PEZI|nr:hypothetical protein F5X68DRAFT_18074 [Plectosphaerella plurivora]